ncbi:chromatin structure-remodeling complex subunit snf2 [Mucor ambiguus]|uniref:Chromatin structure-remodeling complex subunit snf2 n=1 Tax=Mucor ambiguus TaxID=91626 RepID=A0A0C9LVL5_9FUNG|nr:chromatin structure-remodeling complex subunit snf2 [Mucor ambiguus]
MYEYDAPVIPANSDSKKTSSLIQASKCKARLLQSQGATEQSNLELAQIQHQLALMQSGTTSSQCAIIAATPTATYQPQLPTFENHSLSKGKVDINSSTVKYINHGCMNQFVFLPHQLNALKNQIMTYKLLMKNAPLPPQLQQAVLAPSYSSLAQSSPPITPIITSKAIDHQQAHQSHPHPMPPTPPTPQHHQEEHEKVPHSISSPSDPMPSQSNSLSLTPAKQFDAYLPPAALLESPITSYVHASRHQRRLIPSLLPIGVDPQVIRSDREKRMLVQLKHQSQQPTTNLQGHIQSKAVKLYHKQSQLRSELVQGMKSSTVLATSTHRTVFRRAKRVSGLDSRQVESLEQQQRRNLEESIRTARRNHLHAICQRGSELNHENKLKRAKLTKLGLAIAHYHQHVEETKQKKMERIARERMQALKNNDEEAYIKLLDQAKDARLTDLLKQTNIFLQSMTISVYDMSASDYFRITHKIHEDVSQPAIMLGGQLKLYQVKGLQWMISLYNNNLNGILADEVGLGKTIQAISLIAYLIEKKQQQGPFLIIVPLSTLTNWTMEFDKWAPSVSKIVYAGSSRTRKELASTVQSGQFQVLLTTFDYIIRDTQALCRTKWLYLIIDEDHRVKNANAKLTVTLRQKFHARHHLILTGTSLQNNLSELWALLNFILPKIFKSAKTFEEWFNTPFSDQGVQDKVVLNEKEQLLIIKQLHKVLRPFLLRRLKSDVESELPDKVEKMIKCRLSSLQMKLYKQLENANVIHANSDSNSPIAVKGVSNTAMQLRKVCNHPFVFEGVREALNPRGKANDLLYRCSGKFELLDRMLPKLQRTGHRVLIFFQMAGVMNIMQDYLNWKNYRYLRLDDSKQSADRSSLLYNFNQPDSPYFIFLLSTLAGDLGLSLQTADTVIMFDSDWNPHQNLQAQDRAHCIGQIKEMRIFRLVTSNSIEERILDTAKYKLDIDGKVIQADKLDNHNTEVDRVALLRTLLEDKTAGKNREQAWDEDASNQELNDILKRSNQELGVFEMMDSERKTREQSSQQQQERLIQENELPDVFDKLDHVIVNPSSIVFDFDRSRKAKQNIKYDDGLTDALFMRAIEQDEDIPHIETKRQLPAATKLSRKRIKVEPEKTPEVDTVSRLARKQLTEIFEACYKRVEKAIVLEDDEYYRKRCELFMDLVDKRDYPDYYTLIKNPISMNMIRRRMHSFYYEDIHKFRNDFSAMFENARIFNEEGSAVYEDANEMEKILNDELERQCPRGILPKYRKRKTAIEQDFIEDSLDDDDDENDYE